MILWHTINIKMYIFLRLIYCIFPESDSIVLIKIEMTYGKLIPILKKTLLNTNSLRKLRYLFGCKAESPVQLLKLINTNFLKIFLSARPVFLVPAPKFTPSLSRGTTSPSDPNFLGVNLSNPVGKLDGTLGTKNLEIVPNQTGHFLLVQHFFYLQVVCSLGHSCAVCTMAF